MATLNQTLPTLLDMAKRMDPNGAIANIIEVLTPRSAFLQDMVFKEGNLPTGHMFTTRTGLPSVQWRKFNEGITPGKSKTDQISETVGSLEAMSVVDQALAKLNGNEAAFRASEDQAFLTSLNIEAERAVLYYSTKSAPEQIMGLSPRLDSTAGPAGTQIIKADPAAAGNDQTSIWLVGWGLDTVYGITPKGVPGGLQQQDLGKQLWDDGAGGKFPAWVTHWRWQFGVAVQDWRYLVRIANVDTGNLTATGTNLVEAMIRAYHQIENPGRVRLAWYTNRSIGTYLHLQAMNATRNSTLSVENIAGQQITTFLGAPIRVTDQLLSTEAPIV